MTPGLILGLLFAGAIVGIATFKIIGYVKERVSEKTEQFINKKKYEHTALKSKDILNQEIDKITETEKSPEEKTNEVVIQKDIEKYL